MRISRHISKGPWGLRGYQVRAGGGTGAHVATYQVTKADGLAIAAVPELISRLIDACDLLDAAESHSSSHSSADDIRAWLLGGCLAEAEDLAVDCDGCGGPTSFIGKGLYECLSGCKQGVPATPTKDPPLMAGGANRKKGGGNVQRSGTCAAIPVAIPATRTSTVKFRPRD